MGEVVQFPGRRREVQGLLTEGTEAYSHRVYPMSVSRTEDDHWDPSPQAQWSTMQFLAWYLGAIASRHRVAVPLDLRALRPSGGPYSLRIGAHKPITALTDERVTAILTGVYEVVTFLEEQL